MVNFSFIVLGFSMLILVFSCKDTQLIRKILFFERFFVPLPRFSDTTDKKRMKQTKAKYLLTLAAICLAAVCGVTAYYFLTPFSSHKQTCYLYIDDDDTVDSVFLKLDTIGCQHGVTALHMIMRHTGYADRIHTGRYAIKPEDNSIKVFRQLRSGRQQPLMLTIPESRTMDRLAASLSKRLMLDSAEVAQALTDSTFTARYGYDTATVACLFIPNTYEVYWDLGLEPLMERMVKEHDAFWKGQRTAKAQALGLTPDEVCTLASIVDEETANTAEKPMVAGMYLNRLAKSMPLQADPTVKFALKQFGLRRIYNAMLRTDSPWNTYRYAGLPPGPIKIASVKGIDAVLNRADHDYLYMCAKEDFSGTHNFATTYSEHLKNAAKYSKALNERGIK
jgi:UPF0755 protein